MLHPILRILIPILLVIGCQKQEPSKRLFPIEVTKVKRCDIPIFLKGVGHLSASEEVAIHPEIEGIITKMYFEDGSFVHQGDLLIEIDDRKYKACVQEAKAKVIEEEAKVRFASTVVQRMAELIGKDYISAVDYEERIKNLEESKQRLEEAKANLERCEVNFSHTKIFAPINGYISERRLDPGNFVTSYEAPIVTLRNVTPMSVNFSVPGHHLDAIRERQYLMSLPITAKRCTPHSDPLEGKLTFIQNRVHPETGMLQLKGTLPNEDEKGWPGEFVRVTIHLNTKNNTLIVPHQAVLIGEGKRFLFVVNTHTDYDTVEMREVTIGLNHKECVEIVGGVREGEIVVTDGQINLYHGAPVQIISSADSAQRITQLGMA